MADRKVTEGASAGWCSSQHTEPRSPFPVRCAPSQVLVDGIDIRAIGLRCLRRQMALVGQEPVMFRCNWWGWEEGRLVAGGGLCGAATDPTPSVSLSLPACLCLPTLCALPQRHHP